MSRRPHTRLRRLRRGLTISLCTFLLLGLGLEAAVRIFVPAETFHVFANVYRPHPIEAIGYTLIPGYDGAAMGADLRTNSLGFRGPDRDLDKPAGTFRIALIGDSHAFGFGVDYDESLGAVIERALREDGLDCEVWNFAVAGYNSTQQLAVFEHVALATDPDLVVVVPCNNDAEPARWVDEDGWMRTPIDGSRVRTWPERGLESLGRTLLRHSRLAMYVRVLWLRHRMQRTDPARGTTAVVLPQRSPPESGPEPDGAPTAVGAPLSKLFETCRERDIAAVLASFGLGPDWRRLFWRLAREHEVPLLELLSLFPEATTWPDLLAGFGLGWDPHLGAEAHRRWGLALVELFRDRGLVPRR